MPVVLNEDPTASDVQLRRSRASPRERRATRRQMKCQQTDPLHVAGCARRRRCRRHRRRRRCRWSGIASRLGRDREAQETAGHLCPSDSSTSTRASPTKTPDAQRRRSFRERCLAELSADRTSRRKRKPMQSVWDFAGRGQSITMYTTATFDVATFTGH